MIQPIPADEWCDVVLREYEVVLNDLETLRDTPKSNEESALLRSARIKRAEGKLAMATVKADVAMLVLQVIGETARGNITLAIPESQLHVTLEWK